MVLGEGTVVLQPFLPSTFLYTRVDVTYTKLLINSELLAHALLISSFPFLLAIVHTITLLLPLSIFDTIPYQRSDSVVLRGAMDPGGLRFVPGPREADFHLRCNPESAHVAILRRQFSTRFLAPEGRDCTNFLSRNSLQVATLVGCSLIEFPEISNKSKMIDG